VRTAPLSRSVCGWIARWYRFLTMLISQPGPANGSKNRHQAATLLGMVAAKRKRPWIGHTLLVLVALLISGSALAAASLAQTRLRVSVAPEPPCSGVFLELSAQKPWANPEAERPLAEGSRHATRGRQFGSKSLGAAERLINFGDGVKSGAATFHSRIKPKILSAAGKFKGKVGKNPDIKVVRGKIHLQGTGPFKSKTFKTDLKASDFFNID
jgi:hypothetical protein